VAETIMMTTGSDFEGYEIEEYCGILAGQAILGSNLIKAITASVTDVSGQEDVKLEKARQEAEKALIKAAKKRKVNAIIGVGYSYASFEGGSYGVIATGTGVNVKRKEKEVDLSVHKNLVVMNYYRRLVPRAVRVALHGVGEEVGMKVIFFNYKMDDILAIRGNVEFTNVYDERLVIKDVDFVFRKGNTTQIESEVTSARITANDVLLLKEARVVISKYVTPSGVFACNDTPVNVDMTARRLDSLKMKRGIDAVAKYRTDGMIWTCNCGQVNEDGAEECVVCGRKQDDIKVVSAFNFEEMIDKMREKEYVLEIKDVLMEYIKDIDAKLRMPLLEIMESGLQYERTRGNMKETVIEKVEKIFEDGVQ